MSVSYLAGQSPDDALIEGWVEQFHRDGCLFLRDVLPPEWCTELHRDLDLALERVHRCRQLCEGLARRPVQQMLHACQLQLTSCRIVPICQQSPGLVASLGGLLDQNQRAVRRDHAEVVVERLVRLACLVPRHELHVVRVDLLRLRLRPLQRLAETSLLRVEEVLHVLGPLLVVLFAFAGEMLGLQVLGVDDLLCLVLSSTAIAMVM